MDGSHEYLSLRKFVEDKIVNLIVGNLWTMQRLVTYTWHLTNFAIFGILLINYESKLSEMKKLLFSNYSK